MGFVVTVFSIVCAVIAWLRSRDRASGPPSWRRRVEAMGWGLLLLPISWIAMWLFGANPATVGLLLLSGTVLILAPVIAADLAAVLLILLGLYGLAAAFAVFRQAGHAVQVSKAVPSRIDQASAVARAKATMAVPHPPKVPGLGGIAQAKIASLHQMPSPGTHPGSGPARGTPP